MRATERRERDGAHAPNTAARGTPRHRDLTLERRRGLEPDEWRSITRFATLSVAGMLALLTPSWLRSDTDLLAFLTPLGMWVPAVAAIAAARLLADDRPLHRRLALTPLRPVRRLTAQLLVVFAAFAGIAVVTVLLGHLLGFVTLDLAELSGYRAGDASLSVDAARQQVLLTAAALPLFALGYTVLTIGEEVGWRGFAQATLAPLGFWQASFTISAFWAAWHLPLIATFAHAGDVTWWELPIVAVNLTLGGAFLSVIRALTGSVWPAAFGHAMLNTTLVFAYSAPLVAGARDHLADQLGFAAVGWSVWVAALALAAPLVRRRLGRSDAA